MDNIFSPESLWRLARAAVERMAAAANQNAAAEYALQVENWKVRHPVAEFLHLDHPVPVPALAWRMVEAQDPPSLSLVEGPERVAPPFVPDAEVVVSKVGEQIPGTTRYRVLPGDNAPIGHQTLEGFVKRVEFVFVFYEKV